MAILKRIALFALIALASLSASAFDHDYREWQALLAKHVKVAPDGHSSRVDYRGMAGDRARLDAFLKSLSAVPEAEYTQWGNSKNLDSPSVGKITSF